jgi:hypothetical protein
VPREFGKRSKRREKKLRNKKITHHRADNFNQNFILHYFIEKKKGCVTEREKREGALF